MFSCSNPPIFHCWYSARNKCYLYWHCLPASLSACLPGCYQRCRTHYLLDQTCSQSGPNSECSVSGLSGGDHQLTISSPVSAVNKTTVMGCCASILRRRWEKWDFLALLHFYPYLCFQFTIMSTFCFLFWHFFHLRGRVDYFTTKKPGPRVSSN